jgi:hypothetical protein
VDVAFAEAEAAARDIRDLEQLRDLAIAFSQTERLDGVLRIEAAIKDKTGERAPLDMVDERDLIYNNDARARALRDVVKSLADREQFAEAEAMASRINDEWFCNECVTMRILALQHVASALATRGRIHNADRVFGLAQAALDAETMRLDSTVRDDLAVAWSRSLASAGRIEDALAKARSIARSVPRTQALSTVAMTAKAAAVGAADAIFSEASAEANRIEGRYDRSSSQLAVATALARSGRHREARELAERIEETGPRVNALAEVARALSGAGADAAAEMIFAEAASTPSDSAHPAVSTELIGALVDTGRYQEAGRLCVDESSKKALGAALLKRGAAVVEANDRRTVDDMLAALAVIRRDAAVADVLVRAGLLTEALDVLEQVSPDDFLAVVARWAATFEGIQPGLGERVLLTVSSILGWIRADWRRLHGLLGSAASS